LTAAVFWAVKKNGASLFSRSSQPLLSPPPPFCFWIGPFIPATLFAMAELPLSPLFSQFPRSTFFPPLSLFLLECYFLSRYFGLFLNALPSSFFFGRSSAPSVPPPNGRFLRYCHQEFRSSNEYSYRIFLFVLFFFKK